MRELLKWKEKCCVIDTETARLELLEDGNVLQYFPLAELFVCSAGKPWQPVGADTSSLTVRALSGGKTLELVLPSAFGSVSVCALVSFNEAGRLCLDCFWKNGGSDVIDDFVAGLQFTVLVPGAENGSAQCTLPHIIYNDNPSADPQTVIPHVGTENGRGIICEEHRLPVPAANIQWKDMQGRFPGLSVFSHPSCVIPSDIDTCWSMGILKESGGFSMVCLSGALMFNGQKDLVYGGQCSPIPYAHGYTRFLPGMEIKKQVELVWDTFRPEGHGFRTIAQESHDVYHPQARPVLSIDELVSLKKNCLDSRYRGDARSSGYSCFGAANAFGNISKRPEYYLYAWTGEMLKLAWCDAYRTLKLGEGAEFLERAHRSVDFFVQNSIQTPSGLPSAYYLYENDSWGGAWFNNASELSSRMVGCSIGDLIDYLALLGQNGKPFSESWKIFVRGVCAALTDKSCLTEDGIFPHRWDADGKPVVQTVTSAGVPCVTALVKAWLLLGDKYLLECAERIFAAYYHLTAETMRRPFAYATLDASCEDKEAGMYFFSAAVALLQATGNRRYAEWAAVAADWVLTYQFVWEPPLKDGSPCVQNGFHVTGWPGVSPQNHHLDVFFPANDLIIFGRLTGNPLYSAAGKLVLQAWTHGVCVKEGDYGFTVPGEQGEQYHHTNYAQARMPELLKHVGDWRGGMHRWNPSWIIAEVLQAALLYREQGGVL